MRKTLSILLVLLLFFNMTTISVFAYYEDVEIDMGLDDDDEETELPSLATVSVEEGKDAGYIVSDGDVHTAVAYNGNEFLGWYNSADDSLVSNEETVTLGAGEFIAKFKDNNILPTPSAGYELSAVDGTNLIGSNWHENPAKGTWRNVQVTNKYAKSSNNSLMFTTRYQHDIYTDINDLEKDTYYILSYYWMLPNSVITDTPTADDGYYGSVIGTSASTTDTEALNEGIAGDYNGSKNISFVGGQWNKVEYVFYSGDNITLRMFISYVSELNTGNDNLYIDELTVHKAPDQQAVATYKANVSAENGYAYATEVGYVKYDTEVSVVATPFGGYRFDGWYENGVKVSSDKIYTFNIQNNRNLVAKCVPDTSVIPYTPDVNSDDSINLKDLVSLAQKVAEWDVEVDLVAADVNGDGEITLNDVTLLAQYLAGWDVNDKLASDTVVNVLPEEDLTDASLAATLMAGNSEYYNKSTVINDGNKARIAKVFKKAQNGEDITIVGFGGSITEGAKATSAENRYGERVAAWFQAQFPEITVTYINAGIGSTTSLVGIHRMRAHVLDKNPDLVLVDFTTNDSQGDTRYRVPYESVIRGLLENDIAVLSVIYGCVSNYDASNTTGKNTRANNSLSSHLPTLLYYDVPAIDYFGSLWRYINAGVINWTDVAGDYIHPSNTGHLMSASAICYYLADVLANVDNIDTTVPEIPTEYFFGNDVYKTATFLGGSDITPTANTNFTVGNVHGNKLTTGWVCSDGEGGSITFEVKNVTSLTLFFQHKTGNAKGSITINGKTVIDGANCNVESNGYIWIAHQEFFDKPTDATITIASNGQFGFGPIGVTYAE